MYFILVVRCPALATWEGATINTTERDNQVTVNSSCDEEYMFPNREDFIIATCTSSGAWFPDIPDCVCKLHLQRLKVIKPLCFLWTI